MLLYTCRLAPHPQREDDEVSLREGDNDDACCQVFDDGDVVLSSRSFIE
jgi:hypothetical protein